MTKEQSQEYAARVAQANKSELVVIIYELFLQCVQEAQQQFDNQDLEGAVAKVKKAQAYLQELMGSLDFQYEISFRLNAIYRFVNEQLILAVIRRKPVEFSSVIENMTSLKKAFEEVAKQDSSAPLMENTQQVYAGLTYGKGSLNEVFINDNENSRGYRV